LKNNDLIKGGFKEAKLPIKNMGIKKLRFGI